MTTPDDETWTPPEIACRGDVYKTKFPDGTSPLFLQCIHGQWVERSCTEGTVAYTDPQYKDRVYCGFPKKTPE